MADKGSYRSALQPVEPLDDTVAAILEDQQRRFDEMRLSPEEKRTLREKRRKDEEKKHKMKAKAQAQKPNRTLTYLPVALRERIEQIATHESVSMSQVITYLLFEALERLDKGEIGFWGNKQPSKSPRYDWILIHPQDIERTEKKPLQKTKKSGWNA
jgi:hypothetical protein